ncbi:MAG: alpha/beta hydrolase [archaeon]|nr:alpha/beta hydrolase [archaeon]MCR4323462.1 alpha/beta hydrolase [Nanoarchaeota archaeon]
MKKLVLIHGWGGSPNSEPWFEVLKAECEKKNIKFIAPQMPDTDNPVMDKWVAKLKESLKDLDNETIFVGHSMGCQTIIRYLSQLDRKTIIGPTIFVAPWTKLDQKSIEEEGPESVNIVKSWVSVPINFDEAKRHLNKVLAIFSTNDPYVPLSNMKIFEKIFDADIITKNNEEHFNKTKEIKEIMEFIEK